MRAQKNRKPDAQVRSKQQAINKALAEARKSFQTGDTARADALVQQILAADRLHLDAMHLKASILIQQRDLAGAAHILRNIVKLNPAHVTARADLGGVLRLLRQFKDAEGHLLDVLKLKPRMVGAWLNLGNVYLSTNRFHDAEKAYKSALKFGPKMSEAAGNLSHVQLMLSKPQEAVDAARKAIALKPDSGPHYSKLALALNRLGDEPGSIAAHDRAVALAPDSLVIKMDRARSLAQFGHLDAAVAAYRAILDLSPHHISALTHLARLKKFAAADDADILAMREIADREELRSEDARAINFALGKALEDCKQYEAAFACFAAGNKAARKSIRYSQIGGRALFADLKAAYDGAGATQGGHAEPENAPIFILGMPRSGTSLVEQIIGQHPDVYGAGELGVMNECVSQLLAKTRSGTHAEAVARLTPDDFATAAQTYLTHTRKLAPAGLRIADKAPSNFMYIGLIKRLFPQASIVHCRRTPAENALSIYKTNFVAGHIPYAFDVDDVADRYANYQGLMAHWQKVMPQAFLTNVYEELVADQEGQSRKLLDWCGLDWRPEVLDFHTSKAPVHTASIAQVRQPIHSGSVGLAARYGSAAQPLLDALTRAGVE